MSKGSKKPEPREMMELAIRVMRGSVQEAREDKAPSPKVGAILVRPDGTTETAARGELREGNHAEFTLLERKCPHERLDGSVLYSTLEPCLDRNHPKRGCAKHIVSARIREVYVGVEDDNPAVRGKGIEHLRRHGVTIRMFDRDLQETILAENDGFFKWARQQVGKPLEEPIKLSRYEDSLVAVGMQDLSVGALNRYRNNAGIEADVDSTEFRRLFLQQGLLVGNNEEVTPSGFCLMLFGKQPRSAVPQAGLLARADLPDGKTARKEFDMAMVQIPYKLEEWLATVLPSTVDRNHMERQEQVDLPFEMIREAVVNALVHRDYDIAGQKCQLLITSETLQVRSPGGPVPPITLEQLQSFRAPMKSRNPILHYVFARMGMAEEQGLGLQISLKRAAEKLNLPLPTFSMEGDYLVLTIFRNRKAATAILDEEALESLSPSERKGWEFLAGLTGTTQSEYADKMGVTSRTAQRHLTHFVQLGLLRRVGSGPATEYLKT